MTATATSFLDFSAETTVASRAAAAAAQSPSHAAIEELLSDCVLGSVSRPSRSDSNATTRETATHPYALAASASGQHRLSSSPAMDSAASSEPATPLLSESEFSDSPSVGSVRMAAVVHGGGAFAGRNYEYAKAIPTTVNASQRGLNEWDIN